MPTTLLRPHFLGFKNRLTRSGDKRRNVQTYSLLLLIAAVVMICIYFGFTMVLRSLENDALFRTTIPAKIIELSYYVFLFLLLLSNSVSVVGNIYSSESMNVILSAPVSNAQIYLSKLIESVFETGLMFVIFVIPAALAYSVALNLDYKFLLYGLLVSVPFLIIPAALAMLFGTLFIKLSSLFWKRGTLFLLLLGITIVWVIYRFLEISQKVKLERGGTNAIVQMIGLFDNPNPIWLPSRWAADVLSAFVGKEQQLGQEKLLLLFATAIGTVALGYLIFDFFMLRVRSAAHSNATSEDQAKASNVSSTHSDIARRVIETFYRMLPIDQQLRAIIIKDLSSLVRDRSQSLQLLMYIGIAVLYIVIFQFMGAAMNLGSVAQKAWLAFLASSNILFAGFILTAVMTRLVYPSISLEGRGFWILRVSPVNIRRLIAAKFWCWLPISSSVVLTLLIAGIHVIELDRGTLIVTAVIGLSLSIGATGLAVGLGAIYAMFDWESPSQISVGLGTLVLLLLGLLLVVLNGIPAAALTFLVSVPELRAKIGLINAFYLQCLCLFLIIYLNLALSTWARNRGVKSLESRILN